MVRPRLLTRARPAPLDLPMTPMIDVVFQLIIFFLCTTSFQPLELRLPSPLNLRGSLKQAELLPPELEHLTAVVIRPIREAGTVAYVLNQERCESLKEVRSRLRDLGRIRRDIPVILDPAGEVSVETVIQVYDVCRTEGFRRIQFAASVGP